MDLPAERMDAPPDMAPERPPDLPAGPRTGSPPELPPPPPDGPVCVPKGETCNGADDDCDGRGRREDRPRSPAPTAATASASAATTPNARAAARSACRAASAPASRRSARSGAPRRAPTTGMSFGACKESHAARACREIANRMMRSPELEECCIDNGYCCVDEFDLNNNGDRTEMLGRCEAVMCDLEERRSRRRCSRPARSRRRRAARAQCGKPDLVDMVPPDGATGVPPNATLAAHYASVDRISGRGGGAGPSGRQPTAVAGDVGRHRAAAVGDADVGADRRTASTRSAGRRCAGSTPPRPGWVARRASRPERRSTPRRPRSRAWPACRGTSSARTTSASTSSSNASCSTSSSAPRSDDGGTSGLTLMLFQTKGPQVMGMPTPIPARAWPQSGTRAQVRLATGERGGRDLLRGDRARHHRSALAERRRRRPACTRPTRRSSAAAASGRRGARRPRLARWCRWRWPRSCFGAGRAAADVTCDRSRRPAEHARCLRRRATSRCWRWRSPPAARPPGARRRRGRGLRGRGDAAGLLGQRPEPARGEACRLPASAPAPAMGWRCVGGGATRTCAEPRGEPRRRSRATADRCQQRHPRMPDDGEWQCTDSAGATVCMGGERAAGVAVARRPSDAGWFCGARRGGDPGSRALRRPVARLSRRRARADGAAARCTTGPRGACANATPAPTRWRKPATRGTRASTAAAAPDGWCVPERPAPACWLQTDCPGGRCRFGSCLAGGA